MYIENDEKSKSWDEKWSVTSTGQSAGIVYSNSRRFAISPRCVNLAIFSEGSKAFLMFDSTLLCLCCAVIYGIFLRLIFFLYFIEIFIFNESV